MKSYRAGVVAASALLVLVLTGIILGRVTEMSAAPLPSSGNNTIAVVPADMGVVDVGEAFIVELHVTEAELGYTHALAELEWDAAGLQHMYDGPLMMPGGILVFPDSSVVASGDAPGTEQVHNMGGIVSSVPVTTTGGFWTVELRCEEEGQYVLHLVPVVDSPICGTGTVGTAGVWNPTLLEDGIVACEGPAPIPTATPTDTPTPVPMPDLTITKEDSPDPVMVGELLTYTVTVSNIGTDAAYPMVEDTVSDFLIDVTAEVWPWGDCTVTGGDYVLCGAFPLYPPPESPSTAIITITGYAPDTGRPPGLGMLIEDTAIVDPDNEIAELDESNNSYTEQTLVLEPIEPTPTNTPTPACIPPFTRIVPSDTDCDTALDAAELSANPATCGGRDPNNPWDFYNVPAPTIGNGGDMNNRDSAVSILGDMLAVLEYSGTSDGGPPKTGGRDYDDDIDGDGYDDGLAYDRSEGPVWSDAPNGAITILEDVLLVLAQTGTSCLP